MKKAITYAVIFGIISGIITFILETFFNIDNTYVEVLLNTLFICLGYEFGVWVRKKEEKKKQ